MTLDRDKARAAVLDIADDRATEGDVEAAVDRLAECVQPDPRIAAIRALCDEPRPWDEGDADSPEARAARAYNHALAKAAAILDRGRR